MQRIVLADEFLPDVLSGTKRATVRAGERAYELGPALMVGDLSGAEIEVEIHAVSFKVLGCLDDEDAREDGLLDVHDLVAALEGSYPGIGPEDPVTVVAFSYDGGAPLHEETEPGVFIVPAEEMPE